MNGIRKIESDEFGGAVGRISGGTSVPCSRKRIENLHAGVPEIPDIACGDGEVMYQSCGGYHPVQQWQNVTLAVRLDDQFSPAKADGGIPRQAVNRLHYVCKPSFKLSPLATRWKCENADAQFAQNDGVHNEIAFLGTQPTHHFGIRGGLGRLAEHVHINEVGHSNVGNLMSSVVSVKGQGLNQPLTGQAKRSLTKPSFLRRDLRLSRYSPRSMRSTSNFCPGLTSSCWRISAGRTICPLLDTVVVMRGKIPSYRVASSAILLRMNNSQQE